MAQVQQDVAAVEQFPGDYSVFGRLMELPSELAASGEFDKALWVAGQMMAVAGRMSSLRPRRARR